MILYVCKYIYIYTHIPVGILTYIPYRTVLFHTIKTRQCEPVQEHTIPDNAQQCTTLHYPVPVQ